MGNERLTVFRLLWSTPHSTMALLLFVYSPKRVTSLAQVSRCLHGPCWTFSCADHPSSNPYLCPAGTSPLPRPDCAAGELFIETEGIDLHSPFSCYYTQVYTSIAVSVHCVWSTVSRDPCAQRQSRLCAYTLSTRPVRPWWVLSLSWTNMVLQRCRNRESCTTKPWDTCTSTKYPSSALGKHVWLWVQHPWGQQVTCLLCSMAQAYEFCG